MVLNQCSKSKSKQTWGYFPSAMCGRKSMFSKRYFPSVSRLNRLGNCILIGPSNAGRASHAQYWCNILRLQHQPDDATGCII